MKYFLFKDNQQTGPFEVSELISNGLDSNSLVWCEGMAQWTKATDVPEVAAILPQTPPAPPVTPVPPVPPTPQPTPQPAPQPKKSIDFGEAIKICFSKYADFEGRATRSEFWYFYLFCYIVNLVTCGWAWIGLIIPMLAAGARRFHDTGRSGWLQLLQLVPIVGFILCVVWWAEDSHADNEYGPKPE